MAGHDLGERALAGSVLAHDGMDLTLGNLQREPLEDRLVADGGMQVANGKGMGMGGHCSYLVDGFDLD